MNWKRGIARLLKKRRRTNKWLALRDLGKSKSYLEQVGWFESVFRRAAVDRDGNPIPWITYPSIAFLEERIKWQMELFEYGSGNSTLWWARRVSRVVSCEHDQSWYEKIVSQVPDNVEYIYSRLNDGYSDVIKKYSNEFDIIVIDGRERVKCARNAVVALKPDGVIVWDNSDRERYQPGFDFLREAGFRRIDFPGMIPIDPQASCTAIFYRTLNCLAI